MDTCIVVTSHGIYHVVLRQCAIRKVLNHLLAGQLKDYCYSQRHGIVSTVA